MKHPPKYNGSLLKQEQRVLEIKLLRLEQHTKALYKEYKALQKKLAIIKK